MRRPYLFNIILCMILFFWSFFDFDLETDFQCQQRNINIMKGCSITIKWLSFDFVHGITIYKRICKFLLLGPYPIYRWKDLSNKGLCRSNVMGLKWFSCKLSFDERKQSVDIEAQMRHFFCAETCIFRKMDGWIDGWTGIQNII